MSNTMKAVVVRECGGPEVLKIENISIPPVIAGKVRIRVRAFGINRSEMLARQGLSKAIGVTFPRVLGIEASGTVDEAPGGEFSVGDTVVTAMGGMGRNFDGGYAEYTVVPVDQVKLVSMNNVPWELLGALPETLATAWGSLNRALRIAKGETLLIRGGTTTIGLAAAGIAKQAGLRVVATTRRTERVQLLKDHGVDDVIIDEGSIANVVNERYPGGVDNVLELVGTVTMADSLKCVKEHGIVCVTGIVGGPWSWDGQPMRLIPTARYLTSYWGGPDNLIAMPLDDVIQSIISGKMHLPAAKVLHIDEIAEAHRLMDANEAGGKIVVLT